MTHALSRSALVIGLFALATVACTEDVESPAVAAAADVPASPEEISDERAADRACDVAAPAVPVTTAPAAAPEEPAAPASDPGAAPAPEPAVPSGPPPPQEQGAVSVAAPEPTLSRPQWLVGRTYTEGYKTEANQPYESDDSGMRFNGAPSYTYEEKSGKTWSTVGTWGVVGDALVLAPSYGASSSINLGSALRANCRVLQRSGWAPLATGTAVAACPYKTPLTASACAKAGRYEKSTRTESGSDNYFQTSLTVSTYTLAPDGFIQQDYSSNRTISSTYGGYSSLTNRHAPIYGRWWVAGTTLESDIGTLSLSGFTFTKSTGACVQ